MNMFVDVHAHIDYEDFKKDRKEVLDRAIKAGLIAVITNGTNEKSNEQVLKLARQYGLLKPALGLYPLEAIKLEEEGIERVFAQIKINAKKIIAIGEIGLDYAYDKENQENQKRLFRNLLHIAKEYDLPVIVHSRKAEMQAIDVLEEEKMKKVVMHCFSGSMKLVKRIEDNGWYVSIPANVVFSTHFQEVVKRTGLQYILTETDAPFLSPQKNERNEPKNVVNTVKVIADLKGLDKGETKKIIFTNFQKLFHKK
ncbi:TatD family hydrolase [Candidatus Woesearchaeota archaeon]|nr:TatD family hydrolase [Candidatus Woesearchaeota archaeon]